VNEALNAIIDSRSMEAEPVVPMNADVEPTMLTLIWVPTDEPPVAMPEPSSRTPVGMLI
jgi:hypothetical protein